MFPVIFSFGPVTIYSFGFLLALGFFLAVFIAWRRLRELGLDEEKVIDLILLSAVLGFCFSKLVFFLVARSFSGFSFWGALTGAFLALGWFIRQQKWNGWQVADEIAFGFLPFSILAQVGAFLDGSTFGKATSMPWGVYFPGNLLRRQPISLFSAVALFLIWLFLLKVEREWRAWGWYRSKKSGFIALIGLNLAFWTNLLVAFWRDSRIYWYWVEIGMSGLGGLITGVLLYRRAGRKLREDLAFLLRRKKDGQEES